MINLHDSMELYYFFSFLFILLFSFLYHYLLISFCQDGFSFFINYYIIDGVNGTFGGIEGWGTSR